MPRPHIQVILAADNMPDAIRTALARINATASFRPLQEALRADLPANADAIVIVVPENAKPLAGPMRVLFDRLSEQPRATLIVTPTGHMEAPLPHPPTLPVSYGSELDEHDLSVRLNTLLEMRESLDSLHRGMIANRRSGENVAKRYVSQLRLASQVQQHFLPESLPRYGPVRFDVAFQPVDFVSGDIYDVHRLDEEHVGIAIADASGHGIPAALLTVYIKRALRGKEIENGSYRILPPDEVLWRLNDDIQDAHLTDCAFVAATYAVLNTRTLELSISRGGSPFPLYRTPDGEIHVLDAPGSVVGVLPEAQFTTTHLQLQRGDSLILYSDGLERIVCPSQLSGEVPDSLRRAANRIAGINETVVNAISSDTDSHTGNHTSEHDTAPPTPPGNGVHSAAATAITEPPVRLTTTPSKRAAQRRRQPALTEAAYAHIVNSSWCDVLRDRGPAAALELVTQRQRTLRRMGYPLDDLTVLAVQIDD